MELTFKPSPTTIAASTIKCCVPHQEFTIATALWCAGLDADTAVQDTNIHREVQFLVLSIGTSITISTDRKNLIDRAQIVLSHAKQVPNKIQKNGIPSDSDLAQARGSTSLTDYCRLVGFPEDSLKK